MAEFRAKTCWLSPEEKNENIQKEIRLYSDENNK